MAEIRFREAVLEDARFLDGRLRKEDIEEARALGVESEHICEMAFNASDYSWVGTIDGETAMIFGCTKSVFDEWGEIWALGSDLCSKHPKSMVKYGREIVPDLLRIYPKLHNFCYEKYEKAIDWLKLIGFEVGEPKEHGAFGNKFCELKIEETKVCA